MAITPRELGDGPTATRPHGHGTAGPAPDDEWGRMHAALTAWKATSLLQQAAREIDRAMAESDAPEHVMERFRRAADGARTAAAALGELDEYVHPRGR